MPMSPEFRAKAIQALRSGDFTQETSQLGNFNKKHLCCIGVAAAANGIYQTIDNERTASCVKFLGMSKREWFWWMKWNDTEILTFAKIADKIEAGEDQKPIPK